MAIFSKCGMRCDLCLIYRPNVERQDRRAEVCAAFAKMFPGFALVADETICDGCQCERLDARRFDPECKARRRVVSRNLPHCGDCEDYPCVLFPAEPSEEETRRKIGVEKQWTWADEKLMAAYACKRNMDEYRQKKRDKPKNG